MHIASYRSIATLQSMFIQNQKPPVPLFHRFELIFGCFRAGISTGGSRPPPMAPSSVSNSQQQVEQVSGLAGSGGGNLELGELGQLTITNDNESAYDVS